MNPEKSRATPAPPEPADGNREALVAAVEAVSEPPPERLALVPPPRLENLVAGASPHLDGRGLAAVQSLIWAVRPGGAEAGGLEALLPHSRLSFASPAPPEGAAADAEQGEEGLELPSPQLSGLLTVLPAADLSALERGMRRFLDQLDQVGQRLAGEPVATGLCPWVVAVVAAATACEIARRQFQRSEIRGQRSDGPRFFCPLTSDL